MLVDENASHRLQFVVLQENATDAQATQADSGRTREGRPSQLRVESLSEPEPSMSQGGKTMRAFLSRSLGYNCCPWSVLHLHLPRQCYVKGSTSFAIHDTQF